GIKERKRELKKKWKKFKEEQKEEKLKKDKQSKGSTHMRGRARICVLHQLKSTPKQLCHA
ncbi:hypothetical protein PIB30_109680, partial [Stylosanthes scabra]|nr:hypothetical protein [Stylosanthes scabra]